MLFLPRAPIAPFLLRKKNRLRIFILRVKGVAATGPSKMFTIVIL